MTRDVPRFRNRFQDAFGDMRRQRPTRRASLTAHADSIITVEPRPLRSALVGHRTTGRLPDQAGIFGQRAGAVPRLWLAPGPASPRHLIVVDQHIEAAYPGVDANPVTLAHQ